MVGSSKILTVSYGTFSCTLEGFEDSFETMKAIAEYFRDLAAEDRYFGAEPPQPDAEMLARIAEREVARRVEARMDASGIVLRVGSALDHAAAPVAEAVARADAADAAPGEVELAESESEAVTDATGAPAMPPRIEAPAAVATARAAAAGGLEADTDADADDQPVTADLSASDAAPEPKSATAEDAMTSRPAPPPGDSVAAKLQRIRAVVGKAALAAPAADAAAESDEDDALWSGIGLDEDAPEATGTPAQEDAPAVDDAPAATDTATDTATDAAPEPAPASDATAQPQVIRPRVIRMRRADFDASVAAGLLSTQGKPATAQDAAPGTDATDATAGVTAGTPPTAGLDVPQATVSEVASPTSDTVTEAAGRDEDGQPDAGMPEVQGAPADDMPQVKSQESDAAEDQDPLDAALETRIAELAELAQLDGEGPGGFSALSPQDEADLLAELAALEVAEELSDDLGEADLKPEAGDLAEAAAQTDVTLAGIMGADDGEGFDEDAGEEPATTQEAVSETDAEPAPGAATEAATDDGLDTGFSIAAVLAKTNAAPLSVGEANAPAAQDDAPEAIEAAVADGPAVSDPMAVTTPEAAFDAEDEQAPDVQVAAAPETVSAEAFDAATVEETSSHSAPEPVAEEQVAPQPADPAAASLAEEAETAEADRTADTGDADRPGRSLLTGQDDDRSLDRLMDETDAQLNTPEASRRRDAIAQLRAAVVATEAARQMGEVEAPSAANPSKIYRDDLRDAVRPRRPTQPLDPDQRSERPRPAPLKLVASQRVDLPETPRPAPVSEAPVRPRRVTREDAATDHEKAGTGAVDAGSFMEFATAKGATSLGDLLEAAAAYTSYVEGSEDFSRPQILTKVREAAAEEFSREDGLRSFGTLLREGRIQRARPGRFVVNEDTRFRPDRQAG
ncbi:MAG: hypothetical protein JJT81_13480 [Rubellimicrobium sp.]|nr:hypothetical protein [Rubellimicrobium sp.]